MTIKRLSMSAFEPLPCEQCGKLMRKVEYFLGFKNVGELDETPFCSKKCAMAFMKERWTLEKWKLNKDKEWVLS